MKHAQSSHTWTSFWKTIWWVWFAIISNIFELAKLLPHICFYSRISLAPSFHLLPSLPLSHPTCLPLSPSLLFSLILSSTFMTCHLSTYTKLFLLRGDQLPYWMQRLLLLFHLHILSFISVAMEGRSHVPLPRTPCAHSGFWTAEVWCEFLKVILDEIFQSDCPVLSWLKGRPWILRNENLES